MPEATLAQPIQRKKAIASRTEPSAQTAHLSERVAGSGVPMFLERAECAGHAPAHIQTKLTVNQPGDAFEQQADAVAALASKPNFDRGQTTPIAARGGISALQRSGGESASDGVAAVSENSLRAPHGGESLPPNVRHRVEPMLGANLSGVRVHADAAANEIASRLDAKAFTHGNHIWLGTGERTDNLALLAHEATHVVQQSGPLISPVPALLPSALGGLGSSQAIQRQPQGLEDQTHLLADPSVSATPVFWALDMSGPQPRSYLSVAVPGHSLAEIAAYLYGNPDSASALSLENGGLPDPLPPGRTLRPSSGALSQRAAQDFDRAVSQGSVLRTQGVPQGDNQAGMVYQVETGSGTLQLTESQLLGMLRGTVVWMTRKCRFLRATAEDGLWVRDDHVNNTNAAVRGISDWMGGVEVPDRSWWTEPMADAGTLLADLARLEITPESRSLLSSHLARLQQIAVDLDGAAGQWHAYIDGTIGGAERTAHGLGIVRDVSFGVAAGLAGAVAAPAVFAAAGGGLLGGGLAIAGGAGAGAVTGATLEGSSSIAGQGLAMAITPGEQSLDWGEVGSRTLAGAQSGAVQGGLGAAGALVAPGVSNVISQRIYGTGAAGLTSTSSQLIVRGLTGVAIGTPTGAIMSGAENFSAWRTGRLSNEAFLVSIGLGGLFGGALGGGFSLFPVNGLYRTGGMPNNPFSGTPVTPRWMYAGPFSPLQFDWNPPPGFNALAFDELPPLPAGYQWSRLNSVWEPMATQGTFGESLSLGWYGPDAQGRSNYNLLAGDELLGSRAFTRPAGGTYQGRPGSGRSDFPMSTADFVDPVTGRRYVRGHNVDFADTNDVPGVRDSNLDPANFTPEPEWWGLRLRNNLVQRIRAAGGQYRQFNFYNSSNPRVTADGTPIPDGVFFVEYDAAGNPAQSWRIPFASTNGPTIQAGLVQFQIPLNQLPPVLQGPLPVVSVMSGATGVSEPRRER